jgi:hypothetical protein
VDDHKKEQNTKDVDFTILGFTTAFGGAVMCRIIFAAKEVDSLWIQGLGPFADW